MRKLIFLITLITALLGSLSVAQETTDELYSPEELEQIVGPIALYPDPVLSNVLVASTEQAQVRQADELAKQGKTSADTPEDWEPAVRSLVDYPDILDTMVTASDWTAALAYAVTNQQPEVMKAVQQYREKAYQAGNLRSGEQMEVTREQEQICIQPTDPEVVYVPSYDPEVVVVESSYDNDDDYWASGILGFGAGIAASSLMYYNHCNWWGNGMCSGYWPGYQGGYGWYRPGCPVATPYRANQAISRRPVAGNGNRWNSGHINSGNVNIGNSLIDVNGGNRIGNRPNVSRPGGIGSPGGVGRPGGVGSPGGVGRPGGVGSPGGVGPGGAGRPGVGNRPSLPSSPSFKPSGMRPDYTSIGRQRPSASTRPGMSSPGGMRGGSGGYRDMGGRGGGLQMDRGSSVRASSARGSSSFSRSTGRSSSYRSSGGSRSSDGYRGGGGRSGGGGRRR